MLLILGEELQCGLQTGLRRKRDDGAHFWESYASLFNISVGSLKWFDNLNEWFDLSNIKPDQHTIQIELSFAPSDLLISPPPGRQSNKLQKPLLFEEPSQIWVLFTQVQIGQLNFSTVSGALRSLYFGFQHIWLEAYCSIVWSTSNLTSSTWLCFWNMLLVSQIIVHDYRDFINSND